MLRAGAERQGRSRLARNAKKSPMPYPSGTRKSGLSAIQRGAISAPRLSLSLRLAPVFLRTILWSLPMGVLGPRMTSTGTMTEKIGVEGTSLCVYTGGELARGDREQVHMGNVGLIDNLILKGKNNTVLQSQHTFLGESHDQTIHREHEWRAIFRKYKQEGGT